MIIVQNNFPQKRFPEADSPKNNSPEISLNMIQLQYFGKITPQSPKYDSP